MNKTIGIAAVLAAAALVAVYFLVGSSGGTGESAARGADVEKSGDTSQKLGGTDTGEGTALPRPLRMTGEAAEATTSVGNVRSFVREDGTVVRDHRSAAAGEEVERVVTLPKTLSPVQPETLAAVRGALRPAMQGCIKTHAPDAPEGSSAQAVLTVSIVDEALTVDTLKLSTEGLREDEDLKACIRDVMLGHQQAVAGAKDVAAHTMTFPYDL